MMWLVAFQVTLQETTSHVCQLERLAAIYEATTWQWWSSARQLDGRKIEVQNQMLA